eukprot:gene7100-biopygen6323
MLHQNVATPLPSPTESRVARKHIRAVQRKCKGSLMSAWPPVIADPDRAGEAQCERLLQLCPLACIVLVRPGGVEQQGSTLSSPVLGLWSSREVLWGAFRVPTLLGLAPEMSLYYVLLCIPPRF